MKGNTDTVDVRRETRRELEEELQAEADRSPEVGTDGLPRQQVRTTARVILTRWRPVRLEIRMGLRPSAGSSHSN